jgi:transposase
MDTEHSAITEPVRRIEVFTGAGRRRRWSVEDKARIVAESVTSGDSVCAVARRHGLSPQQLFGWRRQAREPLEAIGDKEAPVFVPAVVESTRAEAPPLPVRGSRNRERARRADGIFGIIEVEIDGVTVRVGRGAEAKTVAAVLCALKAGA